MITENKIPFDIPLKCFDQAGWTIIKENTQITSRNHCYEAHVHREVEIP